MNILSFISSVNLLSNKEEGFHTEEVQINCILCIHVHVQYVYVHCTVCTMYMYVSTLYSMYMYSMYMYIVQYPIVISTPASTEEILYSIYCPQLYTSMYMYSMYVYMYVHYTVPYSH